mgnify:CR=1 FL=1
MKTTIPEIHLYGTKTLETLFDCLSLFNAGHPKILLKAYGANINKGTEIAQIMKEEFGFRILQSSLSSFRFEGVPIPVIEIPLSIPSKTQLDHPNEEPRSQIDPDYGKSGFVSYASYQLLFSWLIQQHGNLEIRVPSRSRSGERNFEKIVTVQPKSHSWNCQIASTSDFKRHSESLTKAFQRAGLVWPTNWMDIAKRLSQHDDVIIGLDTNTFYNCAITQHILPAISIVEQKPYTHTPNWLLFVVPSTVMYELEEAANKRNDKGFLLRNGRAAFRGLQEILELSENIDIPGVSLLISGETDPILDARADISGIRKDLIRMYNNMNHGRTNSFMERKSASGDMAIRNQFKNFLRQIDFHKGTYFLTSDKSNAALAMAEGLRPIYITPPTRLGQLVEPIQLRDDEGKSILDMQVPIGNVLYEMAVTFGEIMLKCGPIEVSISCDGRGAAMDHWLHKRLLIDRNSMEFLLKNYKGRFNIKKAAQQWKRFVSDFENIDWLSETKENFS